MKKLFFISLSIALAMVGIAFVVPTVKKINELPAEMVVTYSDIEEVNNNNEYSPFISLHIKDNQPVSQDTEITNTVMDVKLFNLFTVKRVNVKLLLNTDVFVGGETVGFNLFGEGVICVGSNAVVTKEGLVEPVKDSGLQEGDAILKINDVEINNIQDIDTVLNANADENKTCQLTVRRGNEELLIEVEPEFDLLSKRYKLGLWVRNSASGVGTLTYVRQSDFRFGAVGHPIVDTTLGENFSVESGDIYKCSLIGIKKGKKNEPGEIRSSINLSDDAIGHADTNCTYGVYGTLYNKSVLDAERSASLGGRLGVKLGDAQIYCSLDDEGVKAYDIKILKANKQNSAEDKSMIIKITDPELLEKTGGIIQGMSGSPIVQNGKIVGAVTHVFVDDPTRGYGVYIDWMIEN